MAAAPKNGTILFRGRKTGKIYSYSLYWSDVAAAFLKWATTAAAGSSDVDFITAPEDMDVVDLSVASGLTDTTVIVLWANDAPARNTVVADANIVNTIQNRAFPAMGIARGTKVQFKQG